jgi:putative sigma-54 modulation protein
MEVEYTARQVKISKALRTQAEEGMERIARILGKSARGSIVFSAQKREQIAEVTIQARLQTIAAEGKADTLESALRAALEHAENQARRHRDRRIDSKRLPKEEKELTAPPVARPKARAVRTGEAEAVEAKPARARKKASAVIAVHKSPMRKTVIEPHVVTGGEAIAERAMTIEEAVKEVESNDRDLLIFHNLSGEQYVLHRRRNGEMELVELP